MVFSALSCLHFLAVMNNFVTNIQVQIFVWICVFASLGYIPRVELPGQMVTPVFNCYAVHQLHCLPDDISCAAPQLRVSM